MDRIDLVVDTPPVTAADLALPPPAEGSAEVSARVAAARQRQFERAVIFHEREGRALREGATEALNARLDGAALEAACALDVGGRALLTRASEAGALSARGWVRTLRLARTIADLEGADGVARRHVAEALIYRRAVGSDAAPGPKAALPLEGPLSAPC
jgi:magnesium chelatase family protein